MDCRSGTTRDSRLALARRRLAAEHGFLTIPELLVTAMLMVFVAIASMGLPLFTIKEDAKISNRTTSLHSQRNLLSRLTQDLRQAKTVVAGDSNWITDRLTITQCVDYRDCITTRVVNYWCNLSGAVSEADRCYRQIDAQPREQLGCRVLKGRKPADDCDSGLVVDARPFRLLNRDAAGDLQPNATEPTYLEIKLKARPQANSTSAANSPVQLNTGVDLPNPRTWAG